jgi:hypothetical protein
MPRAVGIRSARCAWKWRELKENLSPAKSPGLSTNSPVSGSLSIHAATLPKRLGAVELILP